MSRTSAPPLATTRNKFADSRRVALSMCAGQHIILASYCSMLAPCAGSRLRLSLLVAAAGRDAAELCDRVFYASTPLALPDGRILVERGRAGADVSGRVRVDELTLDRIDPATGRAETLWRGRGFEAHLAALAGN